MNHTTCKDAISNNQPPAPASVPGRPTYSPVPSPAPHSSSVPNLSPYTPVPSPAPHSSSVPNLSPYSPVPSPSPGSGSEAGPSPYSPVPSPAPSSGSEPSPSPFSGPLPGPISPYSPVPSPAPSSGSPSPSPDSGSTSDDTILGPYVATFLVGSNNRSVSLVIDISLSFIFMMCQQCQDECSTEEPVFVPSESKTFHTVPCPGSDTGSCPYNYTNPYVESVGDLSEDTLSLGDGSSYPIYFGCGYNNTGDYGNSIGYFGLGASGDLSFLQQENITVFSYCFNSNLSGTSPFIFDPNIQCNATHRNSTKFITNPNYPTNYIISLTGISVGETYIPISCTGYRDGKGSMSLSSTYFISYLEDSVYNSIKSEFMKQINLSKVDASQYSLDLCYSTCYTEMPKLPQLTLHFDGADMNPNQGNYFPVLTATETETVLCLALQPSGGGISFLGTLMQQDMQMIYDIGRNVLEYEYADCNSISEVS